MTAIDVVFEGASETWVAARAAQRGTQTFIEYTDDHVARHVELAPVRHPTHDRSRTFDGRSAEHLPGLLSDSMPDTWGQLVLRRDMRQHGIEQPTTMQMLTWLGRRTMGALTFRPADGPIPSDTTLVDLDRVQGEMLRHLADEEPQDLPADALTRAAGSGAGGARPKFTAAYTPDGELVVDDGVVPDGSTPWLVKFHSIDDSKYLSATEATYLQMASAAGISVCEHRLIAGSSGTRYLAVRRFDRVAVPGGQPTRIHMATAAGLLEAYPEHNQHLSYDDVIRLTRYLTGDVRAVRELVRRAVFNVVAHNRDDHARNFTYLLTPDGWSLAPAYDLTYSMGPRPAYAASEPGEHYLDVAGKGKQITRQDLRGLARASGLRPAEIDEMIDRTMDVVANWSEWAVANGVDPQLAAQAARRLPALDR
ncbi:MAG: type II toxin-antitoxin system HipA family toxin [Ilumatobacteraceae bacterium]